MTTFFQELRSKAGLLLTTLIIGVLTVFSDYIVDNIKTGINRANTRTTHFDVISKELSAFIFNAELAEEIGANRISNKAYITSIITDYNTSVTSLRKNEYYHYALIHKYWNEEAYQQYRLAMQQAKTYDSLLHQLNPVYAQLTQQAEGKLTYTPAMEEDLKQQGPKLRSALRQLQQKSETFLNNF
ncbi:hypothetical protein [Hymenobacter cellulosivorans]|uniref:Chemotaxis methyl-accepting receptor HlyB-like 4HB MCP domain-containing protein n=1 Tax=Hymenobacter cellulosivorans TaxID=2932249 RepID=A0ABY4FEZ3_9BACT|nr:hypothetical protein [Hymenobacter cellulosivorans]UOQ55254.1 hypothetical protein MUN80_10960 [Hymenobacter cellulosivorans]